MINRIATNKNEKLLCHKKSNVSHHIISKSHHVTCAQNVRLQHERKRVYAECETPSMRRTVSSITFPFIRIRFRDPCLHCRSVALLPFPYRDAKGYGKNRTRSYLSG